MSRVRLGSINSPVGTARWHGVVARPMPGSAAQQSAESQPGTAQRAVHRQCFYGVGAAAGLEPAAGGKHRRDPPPVEVDGNEQHPGDRPGLARMRRLGTTRVVGEAHFAPPWSSAASRNRRRAESMSLPSSALAASAAGGSARTTNVHPGRTVPNRSRTTWRSRRATRWRTTELPTALLTTNPTRGTPSTSASSAELPAPKPATSSAVMACTTSRGRPARRPRLVTSRKLSLPVSRLDAGSKRLRQTVLCDPCDDVPRGSPGRHGCASADGTRGSAHDGGCWAGKYACSRLDLPVLARQVRLVPGPMAASRPSFGVTGERHAKLTHTGGRPYRDYAPPDRPDKLGATCRPPNATRRHAGHGEMLAHGRILWHGPALVSVRALGWPDGSGSPTAPREICRPSVASAAVRRTFVHSCGQPCGCRSCSGSISMGRVDSEGTIMSKADSGEGSS